MGGPPMGPPGYRHAPAQPKKGPPIALLVGGGCGLFAVLGVVFLLLLVVAGGAAASRADEPSPSSTDPSEPETPGDEPNAMEGAIFKRIPSTNVDVPVPPGWREAQRSLYTFAASGDGDALLAFTTVSSAGEFAGRIQHATREFSITNCTMKDAERVSIGPNQLRGRLKEGDCTFNNVPAHVAVVLVESGKNALPLVIYAVSLNASRRTTVQAQQTIAGMRTR
jgi:hypothetical protein